MDMKGLETDNVFNPSFGLRLVKSYSALRLGDFLTTLAISGSITIVL